MLHVTHLAVFPKYFMVLLIVKDKKWSLLMRTTKQDKANTLFEDFSNGQKNGTNLLSAKEIATAKKIVSSKEESIAFLKRAGILNSRGNLAASYR